MFLQAKNQTWCGSLVVVFLIPPSRQPTAKPLERLTLLPSSKISNLLSKSSWECYMSCRQKVYQIQTTTHDSPVKTSTRFCKRVSQHKLFTHELFLKTASNFSSVLSISSKHPLEGSGNIKRLVKDQQEKTFLGEQSSHAVKSFWSRFFNENLSSWRRQESLTVFWEQFSPQFICWLFVWSQWLTPLGRA